MTNYIKFSFLTIIVFMSFSMMAQKTASKNILNIKTEQTAQEENKQAIKNNKEMSKADYQKKKAMHGEQVVLKYLQNKKNRTVTEKSRSNNKGPEVTREQAKQMYLKQGNSLEKDKTK